MKKNLIAGLVTVLLGFGLVGIANAAHYEIDMGWTDRSPVALSPVKGQGPIVNVTFESSQGFTTRTDNTAIGYHHGGSMPIVSMTFSTEVRNIELSMWDLDATTEDLDTMSPVPVETTGDFYLSGNTVRSGVDNGAGSVIYRSLSAGDTLQFRFDDQLSNLGIAALSFDVGNAAADIDGDGAAEALTDGLLLIRFLFGFRDDTLIAGAVSSDCTRCTAAEIEAYCEMLMP